MEVEDGVLEDVFSLQMGYFPLNHDYGRKGIFLWAIGGETMQQPSK